MQLSFVAEARTWLSSKSNESLKSEFVPALDASSAFPQKDVRGVICTRYFVPVTLISGSYQLWNSGK
jgi:hypothetical protein